MGDDALVYDSLFILMANSDVDEDDKVTFLDIKENLKNYSLTELKSLDAVLIDNINDLTKDKEFYKINLEKCEEEDVELNVIVTELQSTSQSLSVENESLNKKTKWSV